MVKEKVKELLKEVLHEDLEEECNLINEGLDSVHVIQLIIKIEIAFGIEFEDEDLQMRHFITLQSIVDFIFRKKAEKDRV